MELQEKWFSLVREWEQGNQSQRGFCEERDIKHSTFGYWRKKYMNSQNPESESSSGKFLRLNSVTETMEVIYPNGVRIQVPSTLSASQISGLIRLY
ncbi:MAG: hypothetical protein OEW75_16045 [Cyclobacteriaceae bacterium]|nr:hypothetical protein [Cyclobacteriaceae bacterium]